MIPIQSLADYYRQKFHVNITILQGVSLKPSTCNVKRQQCAGEDLLALVEQAYPKLAEDRNAVIIVLTDEDIYPRSLGWEFTYSYSEGYNLGVVSTRRMDPGFWGDQPDTAVALASAKQMLTKYIAKLYFGLHPNHDPSSVMRQPLNPDGGPDDLYESDLHPEESANGLDGDGWACLSFHYSYRTGRLEHTQPLLSECYQDEATSPDEEIIQVELNTGQFTDHTMELQLHSVPHIELRRGYRSDARRPLAMGFGTDHSFDSWLAMDVSGDMKVTYINRLDTHNTYISRLTPGRGFDPSFVFQTRAPDGELYGPRVTWERDHFKVAYDDGSWSTFLPSKEKPDGYWFGYQDAQKHSFQFDRDRQKTLHRLTASDGQGIDFTIDDQQHVTAVQASNGKHLLYRYDLDGCLVEVTRADRHVTVYDYDADHQMTRIGVKAKPGNAPRTLISAEYDADGHVLRLKVPGVGTYQISYLSVFEGRATQVKITDPSGRGWVVSLAEHEYTLRATSVRFPALPAPRPDQN